MTYACPLIAIASFITGSLLGVTVMFCVHASARADRAKRNPIVIEGENGWLGWDSAAGCWRDIKRPVRTTDNGIVDYWIWLVAVCAASGVAVWLGIGGAL
jgi:hypothetical protein